MDKKIMHNLNLVKYSIYSFKRNLINFKFFWAFAPKSVNFGKIPYSENYFVPFSVLA
jgi:hypothetical protein